MNNYVERKIPRQAQENVFQLARKGVVMFDFHVVEVLTRSGASINEAKEWANKYGRGVPRISSLVAGRKFGVFYDQGVYAGEDGLIKAAEAYSPQQTEEAIESLFGRKQYLEAIDSAFTRIDEVMRRPEMANAHKVLTSARRVAKVFNTNINDIREKHRQDILYDLASFSPEVDSRQIDSVFKGIEEIIAAYQPAIVLHYRNHIEEVMAFISRAVLVNSYHWFEKPTQRERVEALHTYIRSVIFLSKYELGANPEETIDPQSGQANRVFKDYMSGELFSAVEFEELFSTLSARTQEVIQMSMQEEKSLPELLEEGLIAKLDIDTVRREFLETGEFHFNEGKGNRRTKSTPTQDTWEQFYSISQNLSLERLFALIEKLTDREKSVILQKLDYLGFRAQGEYLEAKGIAMEAVTHSFSRAVQHIEELVFSGDEIGSPTINPLQIARETREKEFFKVEGVTLSDDSQRIGLYKLLKEKPWLLERVKNQDHKRVIELAIQYNLPNGFSGFARLANQTGLTVTNINSIIGNTYQRLQRPSTKEGVISYRSSQYALINMQLTQEQIQRLSPKEQEYYRMLSTPNEEGLYATFDDVYAKLGLNPNLVRRIVEEARMLTTGGENSKRLRSGQRIEKNSYHFTIINANLNPSQYGMLSEQEQKYFNAIRTPLPDGTYLPLDDIYEQIGYAYELVRNMVAKIRSWGEKK